MIVMCCVCGKTWKNERAADTLADSAAGLNISHSYCSACAERAWAELEMEDVGSAPSFAHDSRKKPARSFCTIPS